MDIVKKKIKDNYTYLFRIKENKPKLLVSCNCDETEVLNFLESKIKYKEQIFIVIDLTLIDNYKEKYFCHGPLKITTVLYKVNQKFKIKIDVNDDRYAEFWYTENLVNKFRLNHIKNIAEVIWHTKVKYTIASKLFIENYIKI